MKVLVTGSSGFIGSTLVTSLLAQGHEVYGIDLREPPMEDHRRIWQQVDIMDVPRLRESFEEFQPTHCVHLAACKDPRLRKPRNAFAINVQGTENVVNACKASDSVELAVFASTILVCYVGYTPKNDTDYCPTTPYGKTKAMNEELLQRSVNEKDLRWCIVRPTSIWGPGDNGPYIRFFRAIQGGWYFHPGQLNNRVTYGYVGNCVYQMEKILTAGPAKVHGQVFYLGDYQPMMLREWEDMICREMAKKGVPVFPHALLNMAAKCGDILSSAGWPNVPFSSFRLKNMSLDRVYDLSNTMELARELPYTQREGVRRTIAWLREH